MADRYDAAIVGCGIAGASLAFFLAERGMRVAVLERDRPAAGGTGLSAAIVRQHYSTPLMARLALRSVQIFQEGQARLGIDPGYRRSGYLFLTPPETRAATEAAVAMQKALGIDTRLVEAAELAESMPWLNTEGVAAGAFEPEGGYADPEVATSAFLDAACARGATLMERMPARALMRRGDRIEGVVTDGDEVRARWVVNAAGPWSGGLAASAGLPLEMRTVREQDTVWEARANRPLPPHSISNAVDAIYMRPLGERRYIVGRGFPKEYFDVDPNNFKRTADPGFAEDVQERLVRRFPTFEGARLIHSYAALYDVTPDWYQYVGPRRGIEGYADFSGGSGHGFKVAPAIAEELAGWLADGEVREDFRQLSYDRIADGKLFVRAYGGNRG